MNFRGKISERLEPVYGAVMSYSNLRAGESGGQAAIQPLSPERTCETSISEGEYTLGLTI